MYRVYNCNNNLILDKKYQKSYACQNEDITLKNLNKFLEYEVNQVYKENKNHKQSLKILTIKIEALLNS